MNTRTRHDLDGVWQFTLTDTITPTPPADAVWRAAVVPMPWQAQFDDLRHATGVGWYERTLTLDAAPAGAAVLHFGAVDYHATVWVNGALIGEHEGGYLPFEFDVAAHLHAGDNTIRVRAVDANDDRETFPDFPFSEVPHGKQSWYGPIGGIWQSVWLEERNPAHIRSLRLTPDAADGVIHIAADVAGTP
ncbi:MAG: beta galactosidase jelly roll domain-containing protein, partial [Caldilineaceae bacterium]|nr:beta galactosidase jelly roll domain-containing protein [Caldilineaceae bacterium]